MQLGHRLSKLALRPHVPPRTVRLRLTRLYGVLFLASGAVVLAITFVLVRNGSVTVTPSPNGGTVPTVVPQLPALGQLLLDFGIALGIMAVVSVVLGWIVAGRVLGRLRTITVAARTISASNLHERLALEGPSDELKELGDTFDGLLGRLEASFQAQRQFVANASHELRTPLTLSRALLQVALASPDLSLDSLRGTCEEVLEAQREQERLIEALLTLTRGLAGLERYESFDLAALTDQVLLARQPEAQRRGLEVQAALSPAPTVGDPRLAERLVANLIDNALQHNCEHGWVQVTTEARGDDAVLSVANTGPLLTAEEIERLFEPFGRAGADRTGDNEGHGLGLSVVQAIATAHGASVTLEPRSDGGLQVEVAFPASIGRACRVQRPEYCGC